MAATQAARVLSVHGVGPEARLGLALRNRPEWMIVALGAARLGAQIVPIPHGATPDEREYFCDDGEVAFLLDEARLEAFLAEAAAMPSEPLPDARPDYATLRPYTSGTTGRPKAVLRGATPVEACDPGDGPVLRVLRPRRPGRGEPHCVSAAPHRGVQRSAQRADLRPHRGAARSLRRGGGGRGDRGRAGHVLDLRAGAPLPARATCRRKCSSAPTSRASGGSCTVPRHAHRASSAR